jgi:tetratricopeptide (TPR) repeat protein
MMKKTIILISALIYTGIIYGQSAFETLLEAKALSNNGESSKAIELLSSAIAKKQDFRLYIERAETYMQKGDYAGAMSDYNTANSLTGHSGDYGLARLYALKGETATSIRHLEMNLSSSFRKSEKEIVMDPAFSRIENTPEWRQFRKKEWYSSLETGISEIEYYISINRREDAVEVLSGLEGIYKGNEEILYANALVNLSAGKPTEAIKILTGITASDPDNEKYLKLLAKAQTEVSNPAGASVTYSKLLALEVPDAGLLVLRAECYRKTGETQKAMADVEKYLSLYPHDKTALSLAGKIKTASGDNLKALEYFSENLKYHPWDPECYIDRANSYMLSKSWEWAISDYSMSLDLDPANSEAWLNKGIARLNAGNPEDACHDFRQSLKLGNKRATDYISKYCIK